MKVFERLRKKIKEIMLKNFPVPFLNHCWPKVEWPIRPRYMMAEKGFHQTLNQPFCATLDICQVVAVKGEYYVGHYIDGLMVTGILFPKTSTRDLSFEEKMKYQNKKIVVNGLHICTIRIDY